MEKQPPPPSVHLHAIPLSRLYQLSSENLSGQDPLFPAPLAIPISLSVEEDPDFV